MMSNDMLVIPNEWSIEHEAAIEAKNINFPVIWKWEVTCIVEYINSENPDS